MEEYGIRICTVGRVRVVMSVLRAGALALTVVLALVQCSAAPMNAAPGADETASASRFDAATIARGAQLAAVGNCGYCHTGPGYEPYAGGLGIESSFGTVYSTNITPDRDTGIGAWSLEDFTRAMREGQDRRGRPFYPAFPYDHFTLLTDDDVGALYAFAMTRPAVNARVPSNKLMFPINLRLSAAAWKFLFFKRQTFEPDASKSAEWNRGAYLVEGLAHCGACHTPRNLMGAEKKDEAFGGGEADGWVAPALNAASPSAFPWTAERMEAYLRTGRDDKNGVAAGPMKYVVHDLSGASEQDVRAMAVYLASLDTRPVAEREKRGETLVAMRKQVAAERAGAEAYRGACAPCHGAARELTGTLRLSNSTSLHLDTPVNLIRIVREGITTAEWESGPWMPAFGAALSDAQFADLAAYLRERFSDQPPWKDVPGELKRVARQNERQGR